MSVSTVKRKFFRINKTLKDNLPENSEMIFREIAFLYAVGEVRMTVRVVMRLFSEV